MIDYKNDDTFLLVNKPVTWSSFDVVKKLKYNLRPKKIGHAGTLDPLATGLLVLGINKYTKRLQEVQGQTKTYTGIIALGKTTPSYDLETPFDTETDWSGVTESQVKDAINRQFTGKIEQVPPAHSAIKVDGVRAYKKARNSEEVTLKSRIVEIYSFKVTSLDLPEISFEIDCSKGTYIRSLAHDLGRALGVGGYLKKLVRTRIGNFLLDNAKEIDDILAEVRHEDNR